jgi:hypothetical protein
MADVRNAARDAAYISVGLSVLAYQRAQVRRRELQQQVEAQLAGTGEQLQKLGYLLDGARNAARGAQGQIVGLVSRSTAA